jgi:hypothetical protein
MAMDVWCLAVVRPGWVYGYGVGNRPEGNAASADLAFETDDMIEGVCAKAEVCGGLVSLTGTGLYEVAKISSSSTPGPIIGYFRLLALRFWKRMNPMRRARIKAPPTAAPMAMYLTDDDFALTGVGVDVATGVYLRHMGVRFALQARRVYLHKPVDLTYIWERWIHHCDIDCMFLG